MFWASDRYLEETEWKTDTCISSNCSLSGRAFTSVRVVKITHACYMTSTVIYVNIKHADETGLLEHSAVPQGENTTTQASHTTRRISGSHLSFGLPDSLVSCPGHFEDTREVERRGEEGGGVGMEEALTFLNVTTISLNTDVP